MSRHEGPNGGLRVGDLRFLIQGGCSMSSVSIGSFVHDVVVGSGWELIVIRDDVDEVVATRAFRRKGAAESARGRLMAAVEAGDVDADSSVAIRAATASLPGR